MRARVNRIVVISNMEKDRFESVRFALSQVVETSDLVGVDSDTAVADGTIAIEKKAAIREISVTFLNMALLMN